MELIETLRNLWKKPYSPFANREELTADQITGVRIRLRPWKRLKIMIKALDYEKVNVNSNGQVV